MRTRGMVIGMGFLAIVGCEGTQTASQSKTVHVTPMEGSRLSAPTNALIGQYPDRVGTGMAIEAAGGATGVEGRVVEAVMEVSEQAVPRSISASDVVVKFCPVDGEEYPRSMQYCPIHGAELRLYTVSWNTPD